MSAERKALLEISEEDAALVVLGAMHTRDITGARALHLLFARMRAALDAAKETE